MEGSRVLLPSKVSHGVTQEDGPRRDKYMDTRGSNSSFGGRMYFWAWRCSTEAGLSRQAGAPSVGPGCLERLSCVSP